MASIRSAFFQRYNFDVNPHATLHAEFGRLAACRGWKQGSNSKIFEKAWTQCFGPEVPVGHNIARKENCIGAQHGTDDDDDASSVLRGLRNLNLEGGNSKRKLRAKTVGPEFASYYGSDASITEKWQALCQDCGVNPVPSSVTQCKKVQPLPAMSSTEVLLFLPALT